MNGVAGRGCLQGLRSTSRARAHLQPALQFRQAHSSSKKAAQLPSLTTSSSLPSSSAFPTTVAPPPPPPVSRLPLSPFPSSSSSSTTAASQSPKLQLYKSHLTITHPSLSASLPFLWLRDACRSPFSVHTSTQQKLFRTTDIPEDIAPSEAEIVPASEGNPDGEEWTLRIVWDQRLSGEAGKATGRGKDVSEFGLRWLGSFVDQKGWDARLGRDALEVVTWDRALLERRNLTIPYRVFVKDPTVKLAALTQLVKYGLVFFEGVPVEEKSNATCTLNDLASSLGDIRRTWYGSTTWDVKSVPNSANIAYTSLDLGVHMDLVHYSDPPRYQLLHFLYGARTLKGGDNYFVDAYKIAELLRLEDPGAFKTLCEENVNFEYRNGGHWRACERPVIEIHPRTAEIVAVNYAPPFQGALPLPTFMAGAGEGAMGGEGTAARLKRVHRALAKFARLTDAGKLQWWKAMKEGEAVAFDNRRVLHARTAFEWDEKEEGEGKAGRWLKGVYVEGDSVLDMWRGVREEVERREAEVGNGEKSTE